MLSKIISQYFVIVTMVTSVGEEHNIVTDMTTVTPEPRVGASQCNVTFLTTIVEISKHMNCDCL